MLATRDSPAPAPATAAPDATLLQAVPLSFRGSCVAADAPSPDFNTSISCKPADPNVLSMRYSHALSGLRMKQQLQAQAYAEQAAVPGETVQPNGSCAVPGSPSIREWTQLGARRQELFPSTPGAVRGRLLCYASPYGWAAAEWTDQRNDVYTVAYGKSRYALDRWWRVRSGA
jgi:hypothetical protein